MKNQAPPLRRPRRGSGGVTLHEVAKLAGVAPITASRALNTPGQVSASVLKKVADAIERSGYVPNRLAGGLASARSRLVAAVVPTLTGPGVLEIIQSLSKALAERGYQLILGQSEYADSQEGSLIEAIISRRPDGIVLTGTMHSPGSHKRLLAAGIPIVETWDLTSTPLDMIVGFSHVDAMCSVVDFLYSKGRRHLAIVTGDDERAVRRLLAFKAAARVLGLNEVTSVIMPAPRDLKSGRSALSRLLESPGDIDAVFCSSDVLALGLMIEAQARGIVIPDKLAVIGFGDYEFSAHLTPALTTVRVDGSAVGRQAAQFIVDRAEGRKIESRIVDVGFSIIERDSAG